MSDALRRLTRDRAGGRCEYCQLPDSLPPLESFHLEHIVARQHGGKTETENLAWACHRCNYYKGPNLTGIDPETQMVVPLFNPRRAVWNLRFALQGFRLIVSDPPVLDRRNGRLLINGDAGFHMRYLRHDDD